MSTRFLFAIAPIIIVLQLSCAEPTDPPVEPESNYAPLNKGDIRQIVFAFDSSTFLMRVLDSRKRQDGRDVFGMEQTEGTQPPDTFYYLIKDGYYMATDLQLHQDSINPFYEQRLAKVHPVNGEIWQHFEGETYPHYLKAIFFNEIATLCATFKNVFGVMLTDSLGRVDTILTVFYAENVGWIGSDIDNDFQPDASLTYAKVADREIGKLWPAKNFPNHPSPSPLARDMLAKSFLLNGMQKPINNRSSNTRF
jgi:hypothetical protein